MQKLALAFSYFLLFSFALPLPAFAGVGVGVNLGKIQIDEPITPGGIYNFPSIGVLNTGDEPGEYELAVTYHQDQPELRPEQAWFHFSPATFHLEPGQAQSVTIKLALPVKTKPGKYFAYLEAHPIIKAGPGTTIGVAAATKTYFTVAPANLWQAIVWRASTFFAVYAPWTYVSLAIVVGAIILAIFRKLFVFQLGVRKRE